MIFRETPLEGAFEIEQEPRADARGSFARLFCEREFSGHGLEERFIQVNRSRNGAAGTLRGLHYQLAPAAEVKLVSCIAGALWDVIIDLRPGSRSFGRWHAAELTADNGRMMYVPRGFAHGILTLEPGTEAVYLSSAFYDPARERGLRWDDPAFAIGWPIEPRAISDKDRAHRDFDPAWHLDPGASP